MDPTVPAPAAPPTLRVTMLLADSAQVADRKLYVLGGGVSVIGPRPQPMGVAIRIEVPWDRANVAHQWRLDLLDEDGHPVMINDQPLVVHGRFEAGRPAGLKAGTPLTLSKVHKLKGDASTFRLHPGTHGVVVQVNGQDVAEATFELTEVL